MRLIAATLSLALLTTGAYAHHRHHRHHSARLAAHVPNVGIASTYGAHDGTAGHLTATGERFNPRGLTAAHPTLPFGTRVRVTMAGYPGRSVVVRINDRGPAKWTHRIIDLSTAAAGRIRLGGLARVVVKVLG